MKYIQILNMDEFNPRKDRKKHSWFRVDNTIMFSRKLHGLTASQKWLWICILSLASNDQRDWIELDLEYLCDHVGDTSKSILSAIEHFKNKEMIAVSTEKPTGYHSVTDREPSGNQPDASGNQAVSTGITTDGQTDGRTLQTDGQTTPSAVESTSLEKVATDELLEVLQFVDKELQKSWISEFGEVRPIAKVLSKCVQKRSAKGIKTKTTEWSSVFTKWLHDEAPSSFVKKRPPLSLVENLPDVGGAKDHARVFGSLGAEYKAILSKFEIGGAG